MLLPKPEIRDKEDSKEFQWKQSSRSHERQFCLTSILALSDRKEKRKTEKGMKYDAMFYGRPMKIECGKYWLIKVCLFL